jgi:hypothetical protein
MQPESVNNDMQFISNEYAFSEQDKELSGQIACR